MPPNFETKKIFWDQTLWGLNFLDLRFFDQNHWTYFPNFFYSQFLDRKHVFGIKHSWRKVLFGDNIFGLKLLWPHNFLNLIFWTQNIYGQMILKIFDIKYESINKKALENGVWFWHCWPKLFREDLKKWSFFVCLKLGD